MKAAVLHQLGSNPVYGDFTEPDPANDQQVIIKVKAAAIKQLDKLKVSGRHYTSFAQLPTTIGTDGAGVLADGTRVYAMGVTGMMAEQALVQRTALIPLPPNLSFATAAALPNALIGSDAALLLKAGFEPGATVLINGATGVTGKVAVQMARLRGAARIVVTGRNEAILNSLGADDVVALAQPAGEIMKQLKAIHTATPVNIVLDYLWGQPMEYILTAFAACKPYPIRVVTVGEMAGANISLPSGLLRSSKIELLGSGIGSISIEAIGSYLSNELPAAFQFAAEGKLSADIEIVALKDIETVWPMDAPAGKRIVVAI